MTFDNRSLSVGAKITFTAPPPFNGRHQSTILNLKPKDRDTYCVGTDYGPMFVHEGSILLDLPPPFDQIRLLITEQSTGLTRALDREGRLVCHLDWGEVEAPLREMVPWEFGLCTYRPGWVEPNWAYDDTMHLYYRAGDEAVQLGPTGWIVWSPGNTDILAEGTETGAEGKRCAEEALASFGFLPDMP